MKTQQLIRTAICSQTQLCLPFLESLANNSGKHLIMCSAFLVFILTSLNVSAATLVSNLPLQNTDVSTGLTTTGGTLLYARGFTLPGGTSYHLDSIDVELERVGTPPGQTYSFALFQTTPTSGSPLTTFQLPTTVADIASTYNLAPITPITLIAGGTYWLSYSVTGSDVIAGVQWVGSSTNATPTGIATATTSGFFIANGTIFSTPGSDAFGYRVNATAVPEPVTTLLLTIGLGIVLGRQRHRICVNNA